MALLPTKQRDQVMVLVTILALASRGPLLVLRLRSQEHRPRRSSPRTSTRSTSATSRPSPSSPRGPSTRSSRGGARVARRISTSCARSCPQRTKFEPHRPGVDGRAPREPRHRRARARAGHRGRAVRHVPLPHAHERLVSRHRRGCSRTSARSIGSSRRSTSSSSLRRGQRRLAAGQAAAGVDVRDPDVRHPHHSESQAAGREARRGGAAARRDAPSDAARRAARPAPRAAPSRREEGQ